MAKSVFAEIAVHQIIWIITLGRSRGVQGTYPAAATASVQARPHMSVNAHRVGSLAIVPCVCCTDDSKTFRRIDISTATRCGSFFSNVHFDVGSSHNRCLDRSQQLCMYIYIYIYIYIYMNVAVVTRATYTYTHIHTYTTHQDSMGAPSSDTPLHIYI